MNDLWQKRTYPITFQLCTESKCDRVELYGSFENGDWNRPMAQLTYAHQKNPGEFIHSAIVQLIPGNYEYKFKINGKDWRTNQTSKVNKSNNVLNKDDFVQMVIDQYDKLETKESDEQTRYHDVAVILYNDHTMSDFELILNNNQSFKVHRAILAAGSNYFKSLFQKQCKEPTQNSLILKSDENEAFPWMLKFLYTGTIAQSTLNFDRIESLLKLATMYEVPVLLKTLVSLITGKIDANNCLRLLFMEHYFGDQWVNIRKESIKTSAMNFFYICHQVEFIKLSFDSLSDILNHSDILIANQSMLLSALMRWSNNQAKEEERDSISEYTISDLYEESIKKCQTVYKIPSSIVCFFADGSEKYTKMTINAMNSFLKSTPHVMVGLLVMHPDLQTSIYSQIDRIYHYRILCKRVLKLEIIKNWNPTQYKMDIIKFAHDGFQEIFWMDSDTIVYKDMTLALSDFRLSNQSFYFIPDHVMFDKNFMKNWREQHAETFIPQACFMGFKSSIMPAFFLLWKQSWIKWVEPKAFANYQDPNPTFTGSAFCAEQYALGNAVYQLISKQSSTIVLNDILLTKYIKRIERTLTIVDNGKPNEAQRAKDNEKLINLSNTKLLSITSFSLTSLHFYSLYPFSSYNSQQSGIQTLLKGSFPQVTSHPSSVKFSNVIDRFFDCFFHFYNQNYDIGYEWYSQNFS